MGPTWRTKRFQTWSNGLCLSCALHAHGCQEKHMCMCDECDTSYVRKLLVSQEYALALKTGAWGISPLQMHIDGCAGRLWCRVLGLAVASVTLASAKCVLPCIPCDVHGLLMLWSATLVRMSFTGDFLVGSPHICIRRVPRKSNH